MDGVGLRGLKTSQQSFTKLVDMSKFLKQSNFSFSLHKVKLKTTKYNTFSKGSLNN